MVLRATPNRRIDYLLLIVSVKWKESNDDFVLTQYVMIYRRFGHRVEFVRFFRLTGPGAPIDCFGRFRRDFLKSVFP